jgi:hypothetical protein
VLGVPGTPSPPLPTTAAGLARRADPSRVDMPTNVHPRPLTISVTYVQGRTGEPDRSFPVLECHSTVCGLNVRKDVLKIFLTGA